MKKAYFAGGCFWCIAASFNALNGVKNVTEGYSGGDTANPTYEQVKSQQTTHREAVCVTYDDSVLTYAELVDFFLNSVDLYDGEGQFIDRGRSYTLAIFCLDSAQRTVCTQKIAAIENASGKKVCVSVLDYKNFYVAEEEHHAYAQTHSSEFEAELLKSGRKAFFDGKKQ